MLTPTATNHAARHCCMPAALSHTMPAARRGWLRAGTVQCSAVQCSAVQCSAVQCSAVQYSTVAYLIHHTPYTIHHTPYPIPYTPYICPHYTHHLIMAACSDMCCKGGHSEQTDLEFSHTVTESVKPIEEQCIRSTSHQVS
jgi:hypothetical protein